MMFVGALNVDSYRLTTLTRTRPHWFRATSMDCGRFQPRPFVPWCNCLSSTLSKKQSVEDTKKTYVCVFVHEQREGIRLHAADLTVASLLPRTPERGNLSCTPWYPHTHMHTQSCVSRSSEDIQLYCWASPELLQYLPSRHTNLKVKWFTLFCSCKECRL